MRHAGASTGRRWKGVAAATLILLGLFGVTVPQSRAQPDYKGALIRNYRNREEPPTPATTSRRPVSADAPSVNSVASFFPDNDGIHYSAYFGGAGPSLTAAPLDVVPATALPWNQAGFVTYDESPVPPRGSTVVAAGKYALEVTPLPEGTPGGTPGAAELIARLPEHAVVWVDGQRTRSAGATRYFYSPPLAPGRKYTYTLRAAWVEDGRWVGQTRDILVRAGRIEAIYLRRTRP